VAHRTVEDKTAVDQEFVARDVPCGIRCQKEQSVRDLFRQASLGLACATYGQDHGHTADGQDDASSILSRMFRSLGMFVERAANYSRLIFSVGARGLDRWLNATYRPRSWPSPP
jgi:hypothetical protein